jgi:hypothetical protein
MLLYPLGKLKTPNPFLSRVWRNPKPAYSEQKAPSKPVQKLINGAL